MKKYLKISLFLMIFLIIPVVTLSGFQINLSFSSHQNLSKLSYLPIEDEYLSKNVPRLIGGGSIQESNEFVGSGSNVDISPPSLAVAESNETHRWIDDPTNQTDGYYIPVGSGYQELNASRGQTNRHFYNETSGGYTFNSDLLVNKTGVIDETDWVTPEEYPYNFVFRLTNGSTYFFTTPEETMDFYSSIDNSTIWGVGYESFEGLMAFYLNFEDTDWGHGQYIWYPRLKNGQLAPYNQPLYAIYSHLFAKFNDVWYDKILNDRSLYIEPYQNPRNTLEFFSTSDTFGVKFTTPNISILGSNWNFVYGFKFNFTDNLYHMINEFECTDRDFQDIGWGYEITSSPQSDNTPYQPNRFRLSNDTHSVELNTSEAWEVGTYLENYYSRVEIVSENNESFIFSFSDMENAGFTQKYLNLHDQQFPNGSIRKVLRVGMYGYGNYTNGTVIEIDPDLGPITPVDNNDLFYDATFGWIDYRSWFDVGTIAGGYEWFGYEAWDTGISADISAYTITDSSFRVWVSSEYCEAGEGVSARIYSVKGWGQEARENSQSYTQGSYSAIETGVWINPASGNWHIGNQAKMNNLITYWSDNKESYTWLNFRLTHYLQDNADDYVRFSESTASGYEPTIFFTYTLPNDPPTVSILNDGDLIYAGIEETSMVVRYTDPQGWGDLDDVGIGLSNDDCVTYDAQLNLNVDTKVFDALGGYFLGTPNNPIESTGGSETGASGYYDITWKFVIDWDTDWDGTDIDLLGYCDDDQGASADEVQDTDAGEEFDDELIFKTSTWTLSDSDYSEDGNTNLAGSEPEWFRGGVGVIATGVVSYELVTTVYPPTTQVDVELWVNGNDEGATHIDTTLGASGEYSITAFTTSSASGLDDDYDFEVKFTGWAGTSNADNIGTHVGNYKCDAKRDNEIPIATSYLHSDGMSQGYAPQNGYDDDLVADYTLLGASDGSGAGLASSPYRYNWLGGGYSGYSSDTTPEVSVSDDDSGDSDMRIIDKVGNEATIDGEDITIDDDAPSSSSITESRVAGYPANNAYLTGTTIYYDIGDSDYFTISIDSSTVGNSGLWKTEVDVDDVFVDGMTTDTSALPNAHNCNYLARGSGTLRIRVVNNAGNYQELTYTATADNVNPTLTDAMSAYSEDSGDTDEVFGVIADNEIFFSNSFDSACVVTITATGTDGGSNVAGIDFGSFGADNPALDTGSPYTGEYTLNTDDTAGSITVIIYDKVGNSASNTITITEDTTGPSVTMAWNFNVNDWCTKSGSDYGFTNIDITSVQDTVSGLDYGFMYVYNSSGVQSSVRYIVQGLNGDTSDKNYLNEVWYPTDDVTITGNYLDDEDDDNDLYARIGFRDMVSNYASYNNRYTKLDRTAPILGTTEFTNEDYNINWFDPDTGTATFRIPFTEANVESIAVVCTLDASDRASDWVSGGSPFDSSISISGRSDTSGVSITITITDETGNIDTTFAGVNQIKLDNTAPTDYSLVLTADGADIGYVPNTGYYDDGTVNVDATDVGSITETGSGLPTDCYAFQVESQGWSSYQSSDTWTSGSQSDGSYDIYVKVIDNVGNDGSAIEITGGADNDVIIDTDNPVSFTTVWTDADGWGSSDYAYLSGSTIYFKNDAGVQSFNINIPASPGTIQNSGFWKVEWDKNSVFLTGWNDTSGGALPADDDFDYSTDTGGTDLVIRVVNNAGNYQTITFTTDDDQTAPTTTFTSIVENTPHTYIYYDGSLKVYFSNMMITTDQLFTITLGAGDTGGSSVYGVRMTAWDDEIDIYDTDGTYVRQYSTDSSETNGSITFTTYDFVGNLDASPIVITMQEDLTAPTTYSLSLDVDVDSDGGNDINPQTGYYDDDSVDVTATASGSITEIHSGLPSNCYAYQEDSKGYGSWTSSNTNTYTGVDDGSNDLYVKVRDNVGNEGTEQSDSVHVELNSPTQNNPIYEEISQGEYLYNPTNTYLYYADHQAVFNVTSDYTTSGGSGYYGVRFTDAFDLGANTTDTSDPYEWQYEVNVADTDTFIYVILYNNGGNSIQKTITLDKDTTAPTGTITDIAESSDFLYDVGGTTVLWYGNDMSSAQSFTITLATHNDAEAGIWKMTGEGFFGEGLKTDTTSDYTFVYSPDSADTETGTLDIIAYDNCNNYQVVDSITVSRDTAVDVPTISSLSESSEFLHTSGTSIFWYSEVMGSAEQTLTITIGATDAGGSGVYCVKFPAKFGESEWNDTTSTYVRDYLFNTSDTDTGTITFYSYDNVGNTDSISFTTYKDITAGATTFNSFTESSFWITTSGEIVYFSDESYSAEEITIRVTPADQGSNPSGVCKVLFGVWDEQSSWNDTASNWERIYTLDGDDSAGSITIKMYDNVGNLESSLVITVTKITQSPSVSITYVSETSEWLYNQSVNQFYYGDDMSSAQSVTITVEVTYAGSDGILKVNVTAVWFGDSPTDSSDPYNLAFTITNTDTDTGTLTVIAWTNTGKNGTDTITITRDTTVPNAYSLSSLAYDGDGNVTVTGSTTDASSGMRSSNVYEWWVNNTRDHSPATAWTDSGSYEWLNLLEALQTFYGSAYDNVGNWQNATTSQTQVDFTAPEIFWTYLWTNQTNHIYLETTNNSQETTVIVYYRADTYSFTIFLNFTAWDLAGGNLENVTYNTKFSDSPSMDDAPGFYNATYTIELNHSPEDSNNATIVVATATDNVGLTATVSIYFYRDLDAPTCDYIIDEDPDTLLIYTNHTTAWENDTTGLTVVSNWQDGDKPPNIRFDFTNYLRYQVGSEGWSAWGTTELESHTLTGAGDVMVYVEIRDHINNTRQYEVKFKVDLTDPVMNSFYWTDPQYSTNFYKSSHNTAQFNVTWTETNPYLVNISCSMLGYSSDDSSPSGGFSLFNPTITGADSQYYNFTSMIYDNAGNRIVYTTSGSNTLYIDDIAPTYTFTLVQDTDALESNWYNDSTVYLEITGYNDGVNGSGIPSLPYAYRKSGGWYVWVSDNEVSWGSLTEGNHTFGGKARDNLGIEGTALYDWSWVDLTYPVLDCLTLNESWAPNWYDQSVSTHAQATVGWTESYPYHVNLTVVSYLAHTDDLTPNGGSSDFYVTLTGASDGAYTLYITIYDKAGNSNSTLVQPSVAIINLLSGMSSSENQHWYYFYYFRSDGIGLDWSDFNSSYVLDEDYEPYTEKRFRGALYAQKFLNDTSSIRIITRDYFGNVVYNQSFALPTSRDKYLTLDVYTFKVVNLYDEIMNMTIEHPTAATYYTEQIMPYEIFAWGLYASIYNITVYIHDTSTIAEDEDGNMLDDYQVDLNSCDVAIFICARTVFHISVDSFYLTDYNIYIYISSTKSGTYYIYENQTSVATGSFFEYGTTISHTRNSSTGIVIELWYQFINGTDEIWFNTTYTNPLSMLAPIFLESETNQYFEHGVDTLTLNWTVDQTALMIIWFNGSYLTHASGTTYIEKLLTPYFQSIGVYNFTVEAINQYNRHSTSTMFLTVRDTIPPTLIVGYINGTTFEDARIDTTLTFASGESVDVEIYRNTTLIYSGSSVITFNGTIGTVGEWNITVMITDINSNSNSSYLVYTIQDTTAPELLAYETTIKAYVGNSISQKWSIYDLNPKNYTVRLAGIVMDTGSYTSSITFSHVFTSAGTYTLSLTVEDDYDNTAIANTIITVELPTEGEGRMPIYLTTELDERAASGFELFLGILALIGVIIVIKKKRKLSHEKLV